MNLRDQVVQALEALARPGAFGKMPNPSSETYLHLGIKTATVRGLARQLSKEFRNLPWDDQVNLVLRLLDFGMDEAAHLGVFLLGLSVDDFTSVDAGGLDSIIGAFRGWSVTDAFCIEVLQPLLKRFATDILAITANWATADSRWKRRASAIVFVRKIGASGCYTHHGLRACERLITDSDDLVRKGFGWALKDLMRGDRETVLEYVVNLRRRGIPSVITLYALRDVRGAARQRILAIKSQVLRERTACPIRRIDPGIGSTWRS